MFNSRGFWAFWAVLGALVFVLAFLNYRACGIGLPGLAPWLAACKGETVVRSPDLAAEKARHGALLDDLRRLNRELALSETCAAPEEPAVEDCSFGAAEKLDIFLLQDLSNSFEDDLANIRRMVADLRTKKASGELGEDVFFGFGSFVDKPGYPFGATNGYTFRLHHKLSYSVDKLSAVVSSLRVFDGKDVEESQYEAMIEAMGANVGFRSESRRFIIVITDAPSHQAGDYRAKAEDGRADGQPLNEDYPSTSTLSARLKEEQITPIFLVSGWRAQQSYQAFVNSHGTGVVVPITADSSALLDAISKGVETACRPGE